jgi:cell division protein FtsI (penicillin-binding protein 3)
VLRRFGFGESTGSGFPGESAGVLPPPRGWGQLEKATISYGYGLSVTPLQIAQAYAALANDGRLMPPTFVKDGAAPGRQAIDPVAGAARAAPARERDRNRRQRHARRDHRLPGRRQDRHVASLHRGRLREEVHLAVRGRGAGRPSEVRDGGGDPEPARPRLLRRPGVGAGVPQRHGWRAAPDGRAARIASTSGSPPIRRRRPTVAARLVAAPCRTGTVAAPAAPGVQP